MAWTERYVDQAAAGGGDGTTAATSGGTGAWTFAEAIAAAAAGQRLNVKTGAGGAAYANTTTDRTIATAGTTSSPVWWRGYNTTIGDIDTNNALTKPAITFTTGRFILTGSFNLFSNLDISGASTTNAQVRINTGSTNWFHRCRIENTAANANGRALQSLVLINVSECYLKATSSAPVIDIQSAGTTIQGCTIVNGSTGIVMANVALNILNNVFVNQGADAMLSGGGTSVRYFIIGNSIYSPASDGFEITATGAGSPGFVLLANNVFSECGAYGINNSSGSVTAAVFRLRNLFHGSVTADEQGFGDWPSLHEQADGSSPFVNAGSNDFTIDDSSDAIANGCPGAFENQSYTSYLDIGAVQREEPAGGSGGAVRSRIFTGM